MTHNTYILAFLLSLVLTACHTVQTIPMVETHTRTDTIMQHDTTLLRDSIYIAHYIDRFTKGDTIFIHTRDTIFRYAGTRTIERTRTITLKGDSVPYKVEVPVPVRQRNGYDRFTSFGFWLLLILIALWIAIRS